MASSAFCEPSAQTPVSTLGPQKQPLHSPRQLNTDIKQIQSQQPNQWLQARPASAETTQTLHASLNFKEVYPDQDWWKQFNDPYLPQYIEEAYRDNPSLEVALLRVQKERALVESARSALFPNLNAGGSYFENRKVANDIQGANGGSGISSAGGFVSSNDAQRFVQAPLRASYELDLFGKYIYHTKAQRMLERATEYDYRNARLVLASDLASTYFNLIALDKLLELQQAMVQASARDLQAEEYKLNEGEIDVSGVLRKKSSLAEQKQLLESYRQQQGLVLDQMAILLGKKPEEQPEIQRSRLEDVSVDTNVEGGFPSQLLRRRPDIMAAEMRFYSAKFDVSAAKRNLLPTFNMLAQLGYSSVKIGDVFSSQGLLSILSGSGNQVLFAGFDEWAKFKHAKINAMSAVKEYQHTILKAFKEVDDAFVQMKTDMVSIEEAEKRQHYHEKEKNVMMNRLHEGAISGQEVLPADMSLLRAQEDFVSRKCALLIDKISLYKALGGGY